MQTEQLLCWSGMIDTEHSATSASNEVAVVVQYTIFSHVQK